MRRCVPAAIAAALSLALAAPAVAQEKLDVYSATVTAEKAGELSAQGVDIAAHHSTAGGEQLDLVLTPTEAAALTGKGVKPALKRVQGGLTVAQFAAREAAAGFNVWRSWDEPGGIRDDVTKLASDNPDIAKLTSIGKSRQGRDILAVRLTEGARRSRDGAKPAVLYVTTQHAREWMATEMGRRLAHWYVDRYRAGDKEVRKIFKESEIWYVPVSNPDGYQYTFDQERLWRKTLRDNNGDGQITVGDGVDPNRNYPNHFNYDNEGSSSDQSADSYRGPEAASEPETRAMMGLLDRMKFKFMVNYHTYGPWLLYPTGWQVGTATADDPIYYALSGNRDTPAIPGFVPGPGAETLYITNGELNDYAQDVNGTLSWTPELNEGCAGCGFVFPDDEALVQAEFEKNIPFALSVAKSAIDVDDPVSSLGIKTKPFYLKSDDPYKDGLATANFTFDVSYGDPQPVQVLAKRSLGKVTLKYRINGGRTHKADTREWDGGTRYGVQGAHYYHVMRGHVRGARRGDSVQVWFESKNEKSDSFTYEQALDTRNRVLIVANEDYTGASPAQTQTSPKYAGYYQDALRANHLGSDVYDVDARGRKAPSYLGVLRHYDAVVWYTGDDVVTRDAGFPAGTASRLAMDVMFQMREYMNDGGGVLWTGKYAGHQFAAGHGTQLYDPRDGANCADASVAPRCFPLFGSTQSDGVNDVLEYYFGSFILNEDAGTGDEGLFPVIGSDTPFDLFGGVSWTFGGDGANNQDHSASFIPTSAILPEETYPQFRSFASAQWDRPGGAFLPHTGDYYVYSNIGDVSYKRLTKTIDVPAGGGDLTFWTSYNTEPDWDHLFVEVRGADGNWTTLPDANGHTTTATGQSCASGWRDLHPQLDHYQTWDGAETCTATGTTGAWNAASGNSGGWQEWRIDLGAYAGQAVEISIAYASDWSTQGLGVFLDDITEPGGAMTSFESDLGGWAVTGPPEGSGPNSNNFERITSAGFPEGAAVTTSNSILMGFGLEGIDTADKRRAVMGRAMLYLLTR
jgi:Zinc carboxypeptidase